MMGKLKKPDALVVKGKVSLFLAKLFRYVLLILVSFIILFPFISKISSSFMSLEDMYDRAVIYIPKQPTLDNYKFVLKTMNYLPKAFRTLGISLLCALPQVLICAMTGYALAKIKGKIGKLGMGIVLTTILVPPQIIMVPMYLKFRYFDFAGIIKLITGSEINLLTLAEGMTPFLVLSLTGMAFKNGIFIFLLRQFYKGVPEELEEAAYIDGCSTFRAFFKIVLPISVPMMVTVFLLAFSWQWTDVFYTNLFLKSDMVLATSIFSMSSAELNNADSFYATTITNTAVILSLLPLILLYLFGQRKLIAGIERSGITG